jgi:hypothetical protein
MTKILAQPKYFYPLILAAGIAVLLSLSDRDPIHHKESHERLEHNFYEYIDGVTNHTYPGPYVYRTLIPTSISFIHLIVPSVDAISIDFVFKIVLLFLCQITFFSYQRLFFKSTESFFGVALLDVLLGFSLVQTEGPTLIETADLLNLLVFLLAFIFIYHGYFKSFCVVLILGTLNRETTFFLPLVFLAVNRITRKFLFLTLIAFLAVAIPYCGLHLFIHPPISAWLTFDAMSHNLPLFGKSEISQIVAANVHLLILLGPLSLIAIYKFSSHPVFLRSVSLIVPLFILLHYIVGIIMEARLWMPMYIILIPLAIDTLVKLFQEESID